MRTNAEHLLTNKSCGVRVTDRESHFSILKKCNTLFELRVLESVMIATMNPTLCKQQEFDFVTSLVWFYLVCFFFPGTFLYSPFCSFLFFKPKIVVLLSFTIFLSLQGFTSDDDLPKLVTFFNFLFYVCLPFYELKYSFKLQLCRYGKFSSVLKMEELLQFLENLTVK